MKKLTNNVMAYLFLRESTGLTWFTEHQLLNAQGIALDYLTLEGLSYRAYKGQALWQMLEVTQSSNVFSGNLVSSADPEKRKTPIMLRRRKGGRWEYQPTETVLKRWQGIELFKIMDAGHRDMPSACLTHQEIKKRIEDFRIRRGF